VAELENQFENGVYHIEPRRQTVVQQSLLKTR
jgi:hypothetical protein